MSRVPAKEVHPGQFIYVHPGEFTGRQNAIHRYRFHPPATVTVEVPLQGGFHVRRTTRSDDGATCEMQLERNRDTWHVALPSQAEVLVFDQFVSHIIAEEPEFGQDLL